MKLIRCLAVFASNRLRRVVPPDGKHPRAVGKPREGKAQAGQSTGKQLRHGIILAAVPGRPGRGMAGIQLGLRFKSHVSYQTFAAGAETAGQFQQECGFPGVRHMVESIGADDKIERPALQRGGRPRVKSYRYNSAQGILVRAASSIFWENPLRLPDGRPRTGVLSACLSRSPSPTHRRRDGCSHGPR